MNCKNCGQKLEPGQAFCPMCGERVTTGEAFRAPASSGSFAQPIKNDIGNSESINMSNTQFQKSAGNIMADKKNRKIDFTVAYIAVGLIIILKFYPKNRFQQKFCLFPVYHLQNEKKKSIIQKNMSSMENEEHFRRLFSRLLLNIS